MAKYAKSGVVLWQGPSEIDGSWIVLIATGLGKASANSKTGDLVQTWILRADITPQEAIKTGADISVCGDCPHRGTTCYVKAWQAPRSIWECFMRGRYATPDLDAGADILRGRKVRLGAYGDPAAVPYWVWVILLAGVLEGTGYTHQWQNCDPRFSAWLMASADSALQGEHARALGYRTFRVGSFADSLIRKVEFLCPASAEAGRKLNCAACLACGGTSLSANKASVFIPAHGSKGIVKAIDARARAALPV